jgi:hypothetical protein
VGTALLLLTAVLLPSAVGFAAVAVARWRRWAGSRGGAAAGATAVPVQRLAADLRRLHDQLERTENAIGLPAKQLRCRAVRGAYVDVLSAACTRFGERPPSASGSALQQRAEIYRAEASLRGHGVDVRGAPVP